MEAIILYNNPSPHQHPLNFVPSQLNINSCLSRLLTQQEHRYIAPIATNLES